jgi:hypothetical protein
LVGAALANVRNVCAPPIAWHGARTRSCAAHRAVSRARIAARHRVAASRRQFGTARGEHPTPDSCVYLKSTTNAAASVHRVIDDDLAQFVQSLQSLWAVDVLLLLYRERAQSWTVEAITRELRSSAPLIREIVIKLERGDLVSRQADGALRYGASTAALEDLVTRLDRLRNERPLALARELYRAPNDKLQTFSDAFKLKKD